MPSFEQYSPRKPVNFAIFTSLVTRVIILTSLKMIADHTTDPELNLGSCYYQLLNLLAAANLERREGVFRNESKWPKT